MTAATTDPSMIGGAWIREPSDDHGVVVFVHGFNSDGKDCWTNTATNAYWPSMLEQATDPAGPGIYAYTYRTELSSGGYQIGDVVDDLRERLRLDIKGRPRGIVFVCHSMGGIVVRRLLVQQQVAFSRLQCPIGLFLLASPSLGSQYARWLSLVAHALGHSQVLALQFSAANAWLNDLDKDFLSLKESHALPLFGKELTEDLPLLGSVLDRVPLLGPLLRHIPLPGLLPPIVPFYSAARYFQEPYKVPGSDHFSVAKPAGDSAMQPRLLLDLCDTVFGHTDSVAEPEHVRTALLVYLQNVAADARRLPAYFPRAFHAAGFATIRQRVQVAAYDSAAGHVTYDRPHRARPEPHDEDADGSAAARPESAAWDDAALKYPRAVILGDAGFGKTWILQHEALRIAESSAERLSAGTRLRDLPFPVFLRLSWLGAGPVEDTLLAWVLERMPAGQSPDVREFVRETLASDRCVLLLDAWDEIATDRHLLHKRLGTFAALSKARMLLTSRLVGYTGSPIPGAQELELLALGTTEIAAFLRAWFGASPLAQLYFDALQRRPRVRGLARIPLMLTLMCGTYPSGQDLPESRGPLYHACLRGLMKRHAEEREGRQLRPGEATVTLWLLQRVAFDLFIEGLEQFSETTLWHKVDAHLKSSRVDSSAPLELQHPGSDAGTHIRMWLDLGLFTVVEGHADPTLIFLHRTFQEYLVALRLATLVNTSASAAIELPKNRHLPALTVLDRQSRSPAWSEVVILTAGLLHDPLPLLERLLDEDRDDVLRHRLALAGTCLAEVALVAPWRESAATRVMDCWWDHKTMGTEPAVPHLTRALPMVATKTGIVQRLVGLLADPDQGVRLRAAEALARIGAPADGAVPQLLELLVNPVLAVRQVARRAILDIGMPDRILGLLSSERLEVRLAALETLWFAALLRNQPSDSSIPQLLGILAGADDSCATMAARVLGCIGSAAVPGLVALVEGPSYSARFSALEALGSMNPPDIPVLEAFITHPCRDVRLGAMRALGTASMHAAHVVPRITALLANPDESMRLGAVQALAEALPVLGLKGDRAASVVPALLDLLDDSTAALQLRQAAAVTLHRVGAPASAVSRLTAFLDAPDRGIRVSITRLLADIGAPAASAVPVLLDLLDASDGVVAASAAQALANVGQPARAVTRLVALLEDSEDDVREAAVFALGRIGDSATSAIPAVSALLGHANGHVRCDAARALTHIGARSASAVQGLVTLLADAENTVRAAAAMALSYVGTPATSAIPAIETLLVDPDDNVRSIAARALVCLEGPGALPKIATLLDEPPVRARVSDALRDFEVPDADSIPRLMHLLAHPDRRVRSTVAPLLADVSLSGRYLCRRRPLTAPQAPRGMF